MSYGILASAGIDYITATGSATSTQGTLLEIGNSLLTAARRAGNRKRDFTAYGYEGASCGPVSLGIRDDGTILRVSGGVDANICRAILDSGAGVSRIDVQATVRFSRDVAGLARQHTAEARRQQLGGGRQRILRLVRSYGRGDTLYVGSRSSNYFGRVYDKHRESGDDAYRRCWRYEVEAKGDGAEKASKVLKASADMGTTAATLVTGWYSARGVTPRYRADMVESLEPIGSPPSDAERSLMWLRQHVAPTVRTLLQWYTRSELEEALFAPAGLLSIVTPIVTPRGSEPALTE